MEAWWSLKLLPKLDIPREPLTPYLYCIQTNLVSHFLFFLIIRYKMLEWSFLLKVLIKKNPQTKVSLKQRLHY